MRQRRATRKREIGCQLRTALVACGFKDSGWYVVEGRARIIPRKVFKLDAIGRAAAAAELKQERNQTT